MKSYIFFSALVIISLFSLLAVTGSTGQEEARKFIIAYSNNVEGYLEPCG